MTAVSLDLEDKTFEGESIVQQDIDIIKELVEVLMGHCYGVNNAKKAKFIIQRLKDEHNVTVSPQKLRDLIFEIRTRDIVQGVCATPHIGYFVADNPEDIDIVLGSLKSRLVNQYKTYRALKNQQARMIYKINRDKQLFSNPDQAVQPGPQ